MDSMELHGIWWLPGGADEPQHGTATITSNGVVALTLVGGFDPSVRQPINESFATISLNRSFPLALSETQWGKVSLVHLKTLSARGSSLRQPGQRPSSAPPHRANPSRRIDHSPWTQCPGPPAREVKHREPLAAPKIVDQ